MAAKEESTYWMESEVERRRLASNHYIAKDAAGGQLIFAPVDTSKPCRILDSATADGTWLLDVLETLPHATTHTLIGTDLNPLPFPAPASVPANVSFQVQDINKPWPKDWIHSFDLVHQRLALLGTGPHAQACITQIFKLVKPGGWIQLVEAEMRFPEAIVNESRTPAYCDMLKLMKGIADHLGAAWEMGSTLKELVEATGFTEVSEQTIDLMMGRTNSNLELAKNGVMSCVMAVEGLSAFAAKALPTDKQPIPQGRTKTLAADLTRELEDQGAVFPLRVVWARKPC